LAENAPNLKAEHLYAVVRFDPPADEAVDSIVESPDTFITVKELLPTQEEADREVERLSALSEGKDCVYFSTITRFYPTGRGITAA
jgi:hypothetical protein